MCDPHLDEKYPTPSPAGPLAPSVLYITAPALLIRCPVTWPHHSHLTYPHQRMLQSWFLPPLCFSSLMKSSERKNNKMPYCQRLAAGKLKVGSHHIGAWINVHLLKKCCGMSTIDYHRPFIMEYSAVKFITHPQSQCFIKRLFLILLKTLFCRCYIAIR